VRITRSRLVNIENLMTTTLQYLANCLGRMPGKIRPLP
jgi:hypothetical protein